MKTRYPAIAVVAFIVTLAASLPTTEAKPLTRRFVRSSSSSSRRSSSSSAARINKTTAKPTSAERKKQHAAQAIVVPPTPKKTKDTTEYDTLERARVSMTKTLGGMRKIDTRGLYLLFGSDAEDVKRLEEIVNLYGTALGSVSVTAARAQQNPLAAYERKDVDEIIGHADAWATEFDSIMDRIRCVLEETCTQKK